MVMMRTQAQMEWTHGVHSSPNYWASPTVSVLHSQLVRQLTDPLSQITRPTHTSANPKHGSNVVAPFPPPAANTRTSPPSLICPTAGSSAQCPASTESPVLELISTTRYFPLTQNTLADKLKRRRIHYVRPKVRELG